MRRQYNAVCVVLPTALLPSARIYLAQAGLDGKGDGKGARGMDQQVQICFATKNLDSAQYVGVYMWVENIKGPSTTWGLGWLP